MNYGKIIKLTFDGKVYYVSNKERTQFRLINVYDEFVYPTSVAPGSSENEVYLHFDDINSFGANRLECLGAIEMGSKDIRLGSFLVGIWLDGLMPSDMFCLEVVGVTVSGEMIINFDGKAYAQDSYLTAESVVVSGQILALVFESGDFNEAYLGVNSVAVFGQYCDINGVPL